MAIFFLILFSQHGKIFPAYLQQQEKMWHLVSTENRDRVELHRSVGAMEKALYFWTLEGR